MMGQMEMEINQLRASALYAAALPKWAHMCAAGAGGGAALRMCKSGRTCLEIRGTRAGSWDRTRCQRCAHLGRNRQK